MSKEEDVQRTLVAEFTPLTWQTDRDGIVTPTIAYNWSNLSQSTDTLFVQEVNIDLSGYALEKKSFFPYSSFEQRGGYVSGSFADGSEGRNISDIIIVSSVPLSIDYETMAVYSSFSLPGFSAGATGLTSNKTWRINRDPLIHLHQLTYSHDTTTQTTGGASIYRVVSDSTGSSLEPYCCRFTLLL